MKKRYHFFFRNKQTGKIEEKLERLEEKIYGSPSSISNYINKYYANENYIFLGFYAVLSDASTTEIKNEILKVLHRNLLKDNEMLSILKKRVEYYTTL